MADQVKKIDHARNCTARIILITCIYIVRILIANVYESTSVPSGIELESESCRAVDAIAQVFVRDVYICVKEGCPCAGCLPGRLGHCQNSATASNGLQPAHEPVVPSLCGQSSTILSTNLAATINSHVGLPSLSTDDSLNDAPLWTLPSMNEILRVCVPTLRHVPKAARDDWARLVGDVLSSVSTSMQEIDAWCKVFMLPRCILANPPRGGRLHWRDTLKLVRSRIRMWREAKFADLWEIVVLRDREISHRTEKKATHSTPLTASLRQSNGARARRAVEDGQY